MLEAINTFAVFTNLFSTPDFLKVEQNLKRLCFFLDRKREKEDNEFQKTRKITSVEDYDYQ